MSKVTAIIQARMGSTRLWGKSMAVIVGKPCLQRVIERVQLATKIEQIVVATSEEPQDDVIHYLCEKLRVNCFRGSETDVLHRYVGAADAFDANPIVRVTGDCPLIDPGVLNALVDAYSSNFGHFVANNLERSFPLGLDAEVFSRELLGQAQIAEDYSAEHVTEWMRRQPDCINLRAPEDLSGIRLTLDTRDDLTAIRAIYRSFTSKKYVSTADVLWLIERRPEIAALVRGH